MARLDELTHRRRVVRGPLADLVELDDGAEGRRVAICHHAEVRHDPALAAGLDPVRDFLTFPMIDGLARLEGGRNGVFVYAAPRGLRTARELSAVFAEEGGVGERAAIEFLARATSVLIAGAEAGADRGLLAHGSLDPWRVAVSETGEVVVLGYGLPSLDGLAFQADERSVPRPDSLRYFPPERLDGEPEDVTSDLFVACLVAAELCSGAPVYGGPDLLDQVSAGEAADRLHGLPPAFVAVVSPMLAPYADKRPKPRAWAQKVEDAARRASGRPLKEIVALGAQYLSDVEEDLADDVTFADLLGPEPEDPRLPELRQRIADELAAIVASSAIPEAPVVDTALPDVASARAAFDAARASVVALVDEVATFAGPFAAVDQAEVAVSALGELRVRMAAAGEVAAAAAAEVGVVARRSLAAEQERQRRVVADAGGAVTAAAEALDAFGEDEEAETALGTARAAIRKAGGARDPGAALRLYERAAAAAAQVIERIGVATLERAEQARVAGALAAELRAEVAAAGAEGLDVTLLPAAEADHADAVRAGIAALRADRDERRRAAVGAERAAIAEVVGSLPGDPDDADATRALGALVDDAGRLDDPGELAEIRARAEASVRAIASARATRAEEATRRRGDAGRRIAAAQVRGVAAGDVEDASVSAIVAELERVVGRAADTPDPVMLEGLADRADALAASAEAETAAVRARREAERVEAVRAGRERLGSASARASASASGRDEPELSLYAADADRARVAGDAEEDPDAVAALALRAEAAADAAEQMLGELRAEEDEVRVARLSTLGSLARRVEQRAWRTNDKELGAAIAARVQGLSAFTDPTDAEREVNAVESAVADAEARIAAERAAEEQARRARATERRLLGAAIVAEVEAAAGGFDDAMMALAVEEARDAASGLTDDLPDPAGEARLARVRAALDEARRAADDLRAAAAARELALVEERKAALEALRRAGRERRARVGAADDPDGQVLAAALVGAADDLEAAQDVDAAKIAATIVDATAARLEAHLAQLEARRRHEREAARTATRARLAAALDDAARADDDPLVLAVIDAARQRLADGSDLVAAAAVVDAAIRDADAARARLAAERDAEARAEADARAAEAAARAAAEAEAERTASVAASRFAASRVAEELVESTLRHDDPEIAALLADTDRALDDLAATADPVEAARLLDRVRDNAQNAVAALDRLDAVAADQERREAARAVWVLLDGTLRRLEEVVVVLGPLGGGIAAERDALVARGSDATADEAALRALIDEARALEGRAHGLVVVRVEDERKAREEARRLAHEAVLKAQATQWLSARADLVDRLLLVRAALEQQMPSDALAAASALADQVDALDAEARLDALRARHRDAVGRVAHLVGELPDAPGDAPPELVAELSAVRAELSAARAESVPGSSVPEGGDPVAAADAVDAVEARIRELEVRATDVTRAVAAWRSERIAAALDRARAASARAWSAWSEARAVREDESVRTSVDEAEQACATVASATDPGDADWNAALAVAAADRAEEGVAVLQDEVRRAIAALTTLQVVRDETENELLAWPGHASAGPEAELHQLWSRAEQAARGADRAKVEETGRELRRLAARVREGAPAQAQSTPAPAMSLAERIQQAQRNHGGHAVMAGPTLSPEDWDTSGASPRVAPPSRAPRSVPPPPTPPPSVAARPTLAPVDDEPTGRFGDPNHPSKKPSVADLQARLRARAATRTPPSGIPAPVSDPPRAIPSIAPVSVPPNALPPKALPPKTLPSIVPSSADTSPTLRVRPTDVPTAPRPIPRSVAPSKAPPTPTPTPAPPKAPNPMAEARTTLMSRDDLHKVLAAALAADDDDEIPDAPTPEVAVEDEEEGARTTVFRPSDFGADDDDVEGF